MAKFFKEIVEGISGVDRTSISDALNDAYKTIDTLALYARLKSDSVIDNLLKVSPEEMCDFNTRNGVFMLRLMRLNEKEKEITLNALGVDAMFNGDSTAITGSAISPSYATDMNYKDLFVKEISGYEATGQETTRQEIETSGPYTEVNNLYPDDNNTGTFSNKWITSNQNSLLNKTKKMFNQHKINTIISRFHTDPTSPVKVYDVKTSYGLSHGRNLLTKAAEKSGGTYALNGYDNPYCRVWTHHYKYDELKKMMRPFRDADGNVVMLKNLHFWKNFDDTGQQVIPGEIDEKTQSQAISYQKKWGWKSDQNDRWKYSVLNSDNGLVNIVPKFQGGGDKNIHTKQCMFSIENLAWKDYDPYSFEKALSWEQRGPMGGRIMWFPPYGINITENVTAQWTNHSFVGRGEDVYTYVNTVRTGTLNFMMVVDHPSILDYTTWYDEASTNIKDTDVYRFFAGCDPADSNNPDSLLYHAKPTPLTDEYVEKDPEIEDVAEAKLNKTNADDECLTVPVELTFYVFYPNNYSGVYDWVGQNSLTGSEDSKVEAIPYLLYGWGAQMKTDGSLKTTVSIPLNFSEPSLISEHFTGYEMSKNMVDGKPEENGNPIQNNYIVGCTQRWSNLQQRETYNVVTTSNKEENKRWYYRIDGEYETEYNGSKNFYRNCYDQQIPYVSRYDNNTGKLNLDVSAVKSAFSEESNNENLFSLAEVATVLCGNEEICSKIGADSERVSALKDYLTNEKYTIDKVIIQGYSNEHGKMSPLEEGRNNALAEGRAETVKNWLANCSISKGWNVEIGANLPSQPIDSGSNTSHNNVEAKKWRSAKVVIYLNSVEQKTQSETDQTQKRYEFDEDMMKDWSEQIFTEIRKITYGSEAKMNENKDNDVKRAIDNVLDKVDFYDDIKANNKEEFYNAILGNVKFENGELIVGDAAIEDIFKIMDSYVTEDVGSIFNNFKEFDTTLGDEIRKQITSLKKYEDLRKKIVKFVEQLNKYNDKIESYKTAIDNAVSNINSYYEKRTEKKKSLEAANTNIDKYTELIKTTTDAKLKGDYEYELKKYTDEKNSIEKEIEKINNDVSKENDAINKNYDNIIKAVEDTNNYTKNNEDVIVGIFLEYKYSRSNQTDPDKVVFTHDVYLSDGQIFSEYLQKILDEERNNITMPDLEKSDFSGTIKKYIKNKGTIEDHYVDDITDKFSDTVLNKVKIELQGSTVNDFNFAVVFEENIYEDYNKLIQDHVDVSDKKTRVLQDDLKKAILGITYGIKDGENSFSSTRLTDLNEDKFKALVDDLESRTLAEDKTEANKSNFINLVRDCLTSSVYICTEINADLSALTEKIKKEAEEKNNVLDNTKYVGFSEHTAADGSVYYINENETDASKMGRQWVLENDQFVLKSKAQVEALAFQKEDGTFEGDTNQWRYDQEYHFFKALKEQNRMGYEALMEKIKYFNPAYHSMTPEGFNARLTFLHQCTRQGNTTTVSDNIVSSANNLAFGRQPYCVLRLGDFYNQMIVIDNISINYDESGALQWDLNQEGIGVQPLLAHVSISFKFIGGGDIGGPVKRLQNAMTSNYYANASLYDNRADRMTYGWSEKTNGALEDDRQLDTNSSYFHVVQNYKPKQ